MVIEANKPTKALRVIAVFEAVKGVIGIVFAMGMRALGEHHVYPWVRWMVEHFRFMDAIVAPRKFVEVLPHPEQFPLTLCIVAALAYTALRFAEAYGLWLARRWGEWLTLVGAALYLPFEVYWLSFGATFIKIALLVSNAALVVYLAVVLAQTRRKRAHAARENAAGGALGSAAGRG